MTYLERKARKKELEELESRLIRVAEAFGLKKQRASTRSPISSVGRAVLIACLVALSALLAHLLVGRIVDMVPPETAPRFYAGLAVLSAASLVACFKGISDIVFDYWRPEAQGFVQHLHFVAKTVFVFLPLFLAVYATNKYIEAKSEAHIYLTAIAPISSSSDGLFRFNVVFGDPDLKSVEAGWGAVIQKDNPSITIQNEPNRDFLQVMGRRLRDCGQTTPVELDIVGYFSSPLWKVDRLTGRHISDEDFARVKKDGRVDVLRRDGSVVPILLDKDGNRARFEKNVESIQSLKMVDEAGRQRAADTHTAFNLWVAEQRADSVCRALLGRKDNQQCADVTEGPINVRNVSRKSTYDELSSRLQKQEPVPGALVPELDAADQRVLARSVEVIVRKAGACEVPVSN